MWVGYHAGAMAPPPVSRQLGTLLLVLALAASAACGGSGGEPAAQPAGSIKVSMSEFKFSPSDISAPAGKVVIYLVNSGQAPHDMVVLDPGGKQVAKSKLVQAGNATTFTIDNLAAGTYTVVCDVPGHREAGMVGTLTGK